MCKKMRSSNFENKSPHEGGYERGEKMNVPRREKGGGEVHSAGGVRNFSEYCVRKEKKD